MTDNNPYQPSATAAGIAKPSATIPRDTTLASYCSFVGFTLLVVALLLVWPAIFHLLMATDSIASVISYSPPIFHFLLAFVFMVSSLSLLAAALLTFKIGKYITLGARPDFVLRMTLVHLIYFPLGTILFFWVRHLANFDHNSK